MLARHMPQCIGRCRMAPCQPLLTSLHPEATGGHDSCGEAPAAITSVSDQPPRGPLLLTRKEKSNQPAFWFPRWQLICLLPENWDPMAKGPASLLEGVKDAADPLCRSVHGESSVRSLKG